MKLMAWLSSRRRQASVLAPMLPTQPQSVVSSFDDVAERADWELLATARASLDSQMHEAINRNADGVNRAAIALRRETDLLLTLGISDPFAGKAGSYAQMALALANAGRGLDLQSQPHNLAPSERADLVARAMTLILRAETLMAAAKNNNRTNIETALARQEQLMRGVRASLVCQQS